MLGMTRALSRINSIALMGALLGLYSLVCPYFILHPNRVMPLGEPFTLFQLPGPFGWVALGGWLLLLVAACWTPGRLRPWAIAAAASWVAISYATSLGSGSLGVVGDNEYARLDLVSGTWVGLLALYFALFAVYYESRRLLLVPVLGLCAAVFLSSYAHLGVMREYAVVSDIFREEFLRHIGLAAAALPLTILIGFPLGVLAVRKPALESPILSVSGFLQTVPSVALFGLLLPVLSRYGRSMAVGTLAIWTALGLVVIGLAWWVYRSGRLRTAAAVAIGVGVAGLIVLLLPVLGLALFQSLLGGTEWMAALRWDVTLDQLGLRGLGAAPALVALTLYGVLPLIVNTHVGLKGVPAGTVEAARGMGMSPRQVFWRVEVPICAPFLIEGMRGTLLLLIGLATVAVLVNAGGLGYFLMRGMEQSVLNLVLLGSMPVVLLALAADGLTRLLAWGLMPKGLRP